MILVTGATGLVGSHLLVALLQENEAVKALYRSNAQIEKTKKVFAHKNQLALFENIQWVKGDITDIPSLEMAFEKVTHVYHCAAVVSFDPREEESIRKVNIEGTANIVNCCLDFKIKKLCHVSSIAALGDLAEHETIITEETEWNPEKPHSDYAISKYGAEMEIWRGQQEGLKTIIINPGVILGPGFENQGSGVLFKTIKKTLPFYTTGSTAFVSVLDVVSVARRLMISELSNQRYILSANSYSYKEFSVSICSALQLKQPTIGLKNWQLNLASKLDWLFTKLGLKSRSLTQDMARTLNTESNYSNQKLKIALDFHFIDIPTYIKETIQLNLQKK